MTDFLIVSLLFFLMVVILFSEIFLGIFSVISLFMFFFFIGNFLFLKMKCLNYFFIFLSFWLIYFLLKCGKKVLKWVYPSFFLIFYCCFLTKNIFLFFIFFELSLIPTYFLVVSGVTPERILAGNYLILYTFLGGLPLLFKVMNFGFLEKSLFYFYFKEIVNGFFYFFVFAFLIKLPIFFFHLWLPKAHVEASTEGSMILAGILLKLGSYGLILFCGSLNFNQKLSVFVMLGGILAGIFSLLQIDLKGFIAYSSIIHMSYIVLSSFNLIYLGLIGVIFMSVGHGFISAGMFYMLSLVYKYSGSRKIYFLNGVLNVYYFAFFFCGLCLILNSSAPLSMNFLGEIFMFMKGSVILKFWNFIMVLLLNLLGGCISILFFLFLFHGKLKNNSFNLKMKKISILFFFSLFSFIFFPLMKIL